MVNKLMVNKQGARDSGTRKRVIDSAIACITEEGFYRASSNAIAERAGLSWGVIQYHFGNRELLMLAVLEEGTRRLVEDLSTADIVGETLTERIQSYGDILTRYYADPHYLAFLQVLLNLRHDPRTSAQTRETMTQITGTVEEQLDRLTRMLFAGMAVRQNALRGLVFHVLRGLALSDAMLGALPFDTPQQLKNLPAQRRLAAEALALLIEKETSR
jgi:TetR/AcrR family transcriptional regulator, regulator of cefoperazone and chloramphenicol sensitivity